MRFLVFGLVLLSAAGTEACRRTPQEKAAVFLNRGKDEMARREYARAVLEFKNAAKLTPKDAEILYQMGLAYLGEGNLNEGVAALFHAQQVDPKHAATRVKLAELMARSGDAELAKEGEGRMKELLEASPGNVDALNVLAMAELELGDSQAAEEHLKEALAKLPTNGSSAVGLASVYVSRHDNQNAEKILKEQDSAAPSVDASVALARFYVLTGDWKNAKSAFENAVKLSPEDADALLGLAAVERRAGDKEHAEQTYRKLASLKDRRYQHLHALYLFHEGRREDALKEFEALAKKSPGDRASRDRLVIADMVSGRTAAAEGIVTAALKAEPNDMDALLLRSQILLNAGRDRDAEADLNQLLHFMPDSVPAHLLMARVWEVRGDRARQNAELTEALRYDPTLLAARIALARTLAVSGSPTAALEVLNEAPAEESRSAALLLEKNVAKYMAGDRGAFREGVAQSLAEARGPETLLQDAVEKLTEKNYQGARASIEESLKKNPESIRALRAEAYSYLAQGQPKEAARFLSGYALQSKSARVGEYVGEWLLSQGDAAGARKVLDRAKTLDPEFAAPELVLVKVDLAEGKTDQARTRLGQILARDPRSFAGHVLSAALETRSANFTGAIEHYRKALQVQPHSQTVLNNLAYLLADQANRADEALTYAQEAVEANPKNPDAAGTLGWVYFRKGLYKEAAVQLQKAEEEDRGSKQTNAVIRRYHLAMTYFKLGDAKRGREVLMEAMQQNPDLPEAGVARAMMP